MSRVFTLATPTKCQNTVIYQWHVFTSLRYKVISMSARSMPPMLLLNIETILGHGTAFPTWLLLHHPSIVPIISTLIQYETRWTMLLSNHLTAAIPELLSTWKSTDPLSCLLRLFNEIRGQTCNWFGLMVPTAYNPTHYR